MDERIRNILHAIIDALGGGHQHLHDAVDADAKPAGDAPADPAAGA